MFYGEISQCLMGTFTSSKPVFRAAFLSACGTVMTTTIMAVKLTARMKDYLIPKSLHPQ